MTNDTIMIPLTMDEISFVLELLNNERYTSNTNAELADVLSTRLAEYTDWAVAHRAMLAEYADRCAISYAEEDAYWSAREAALNDEHIDADWSARAAKDLSEHLRTRRY